MSWVGAAFAAVGLFSSLKNSSDQASMMNANARIASNNAAMQSAWGAAEADRIRRQGVMQRGTAIAATGASGVDTGTGSILDVISDDAVQNELDALNAKYRGDAAAKSESDKASIYKWRANTISSNAPLSALGAAFSGYAAGSSVSGLFSGGGGGGGVTPGYRWSPDWGGVE